MNIQLVKMKTNEMVLLLFVCRDPTDFGIICKSGAQKFLSNLWNSLHISVYGQCNMRFP